MSAPSRPPLAGPLTPDAPPRPPGPSVAGPPHVHCGASLAAVERTVLLALVPCLLVAVWNAGRRVNLAAAAGGLGTDDARARWLDALGVGRDVDSVAACALHGALYVVPILAVAYATGLAWELLFARGRRRARTPGLLALATIFTLLLPAPAPLPHVVLGMSFGVVFGKEVFGGTGMGFLPPAALAVAFLQLAYPGAMAGDVGGAGLAGYAGTTVFARVATEGPGASGGALRAFLGDEPGRLGETSALACLVGAAVLWIGRIVSWKALVAMPIGVVLGVLALRALGSAPSPVLALPWHEHLVLGGVAFGAVFVAADPTTAPWTDGGRIALGLVAGLMVALLRTAHPSHPDGTVFAILLGGVFAPLADEAVVAAHARRRARRRAVRRG